MTSLSLPFPPSGHKLFKRHNGKHLSEEYARWRDAAGWELRAQRPKPVFGQVSLLVELVPPDKRRRDCTNYTKAPEDLLVMHGLIESDDSRHVREVTARWLDAGEPCRVTITQLKS